MGDVSRAVRHGREAGSPGRAAGAVALERLAGQVVQLVLAAAVLLVIGVVFQGMGGNPRSDRIAPQPDAPTIDLPADIGRDWEPDDLSTPARPSYAVSPARAVRAQVLVKRAETTTFTMTPSGAVTPVADPVRTPPHRSGGWDASIDTDDDAAGWDVEAAPVVRPARAVRGLTLLAALAARTRRLRLGLLVTSNRFRPPALLAKIATTVDVVSDGRLGFGIGVGSRPSHPMARREYAAVWNIPGGDIDDVRARSAVLDRYCAEIGRDPASIMRSVRLPGAYDEPDVTRDAIGQALDAGFTHVVLGLPAPWPEGVARWVADELITAAAH